jgi:hypothetical protein
MVSHMNVDPVIVTIIESVNDVYRLFVANCYVFHVLYDPAATSSFRSGVTFSSSHTPIDRSICHSHNYLCNMAGLTIGSGSTSSSDSVTEDFSPRHTYAEDPAIIKTSGEGSPPLASIGTTAPFSKASLQLQTESGYNPTQWKCKGYGPADDYVYFDGAEGTSDMRFLIDLESPSMERRVGHSCRY